MPRFSDSNIESDAIIGKEIDLEELFDRRIVIEKIKIEPTKFSGKNTSGMRMQMQVVLTTFNEEPDKDGDYYTKDASGSPVGERRSCFTGSDILIGAVQKAESNLPAINAVRLKNGLKALHLFSMDTTIVKVGKCFQFT